MNRRAIRTALTTIGLILIALPSLNMAAFTNRVPTSFNKLEVKETTQSFQSDGKSISVQQFDPAGQGKFPAVLVLYGSGGMNAGGDAFEYYSRLLASQGYVVLLVHYFDRTATISSDPTTSFKNFLPWLKTIGDAVTYATKQANVDDKRIGLLGFSLGAYLSLSLASQDARIKTVGEFFGGMPDFFAHNLRQMPPTIIIHGEADATVPVQEAYKLERLFKEKNISFEMKIYPGQGHGFRGEAGNDALQRTLAFFEKNLKGQAQAGGK